MTSGLSVALDATVFELHATGVAKTTLMLYEACARQCPGLRVFAIHRHELAPSIPVLPAPLVSVTPCRWMPGRVWRATALPAVAALRAADAVHFPWNGKIPRMLPGTPVVMTLHDVLPLEIPGFFRTPGEEAVYTRGVQRDLDRADVILTVSEWSRTQILKRFKLRSYPVVLHHGTTLPVDGASEATPRAEAPGGRDYFLYVGGYHPRKGLVPLLKTFLELRRGNRISSNLLLTGEPTLFSEQFRLLLAEGRSAGAIREAGYVSDTELSALYRRAKALVYPSRFEGFGLPPLEAMAMGCPVLTTRGTAIPEVCGDAVLYADPEDGQSFADAIVALEVNPELRRRLGRAGVERAANFSWTAAAAKYLEVISSLAKVTSRGGAAARRGVRRG